MRSRTSLVGAAGLLLALPIASGCGPRQPEPAQKEISRDAAPPTPQPTVQLKGKPSEEGQADFLISNQGLSAKATVEEAVGYSTTTEACLGSVIRFGNVSNKIVGLEGALRSTDIFFTIGVAKPGEILQFPADAKGDYVVRAADHEGWLFGYSVVDCADEPGHSTHPAVRR